MYTNKQTQYVHIHSLRLGHQKYPLAIEISDLISAGALKCESNLKVILGSRALRVLLGCAMLIPEFWVLLSSSLYYKPKVWDY